MADLIAELKALRLYGMASSYAEALENSTGAGMEQATWLLRHLIQAEQTDRGLRSIRYQMQSARFPVHRDLAVDIPPMRSHRSGRMGSQRSGPWEASAADRVGVGV